MTPTCGIRSCAIPAETDSTKTVCFDLDGTLCTNTHGAYEDAKPFPWAIRRLNALAAAGHRIVVFTARGSATGIDWTETTRGQLDSWGVRYDELRLGKPSADAFVDDRAVHTTAWREGDARAVPGFGVPLPPTQAEPLPAVLAHQRTTVVASGRTYAGTPFRLEPLVDALLTRAGAAGIRALPATADVKTAVEAAVRGRDGDVVFTVALPGELSPAFLDLAAERSGEPEITARPLAEVAAALAPLVAADVEGPLALHLPADGFGGALAGERDGALVVDPEGDELGRTLLGELAAEAGIEVAEGGSLEELDGVFEAVLPLGLLRAASVGETAVGTSDTVRAALAARLGERVGIDIDAELTALAVPLELEAV